MNKFLIPVFLVFLSVVLAGCSETQYVAHVAKQIALPGDTPRTVGHYKVGNSYVIKGRRYYPKERFNFTQTGTASWYGPGFHGKMTANGEIYNQNDLTAAHRTLQLPSIIRVTNVRNGRSIILRVNDRGPYAHNRVLDVSERAATLLGFKKQGVTKIRLEVLPEASRQVAAKAKAGIDTTGYEVALNRNGGRVVPPTAPVAPQKPTVQYASTSPSVQPVQQVALDTVSASRVAPSAPASNVVTPPSIPNGNIYVQAGSFASEQNALALSSRLSSYGSSRVYLTQVGAQPYYRVRLGPYEDRLAASDVLASLNSQGNKNAVIVVD